MRPIIPEIATLTQYLFLYFTDPDIFRPDSCPYCCLGSPWSHGCYYRKADRINPSESTLNPIPIRRFRCRSNGCGRTCSVLPECIPPRRWYLWTVQQVALMLIFNNHSARSAAQQLLPSRHTVKRWYLQLHEKFALHASHLRSRYSILGYQNTFESFWQVCLAKHPLSQVMRYLNNVGIPVP